jgi:hypothetical protein
MVVSSAGLRPKSDCSGKAPEAIAQVNYRPILSSERVPHIKKPAIVRRKTKKIWSWAPDGSPTPRQTGRPTVGRKLTSASDLNNLMKLQRPKNKVLRTTGKFPRNTPIRDMHISFQIPYVYDYITKLCRQQTQVIQHH